MIEVHVMFSALSPVWLLIAPLWGTKPFLSELIWQLTQKKQPSFDKTVR